MPKFGAKNVLFRYFWPRILKNYCHIWNQHLQIYLIAKFCKKAKVPKFGTKNALSWILLRYFGYFWARIWKNYCHIWNQHARNCLIAEFSKKTKKSKFGTKNASFEYIWAKISKKQLQYLKVPSNLSNCKILQKKIMPKFEAKNAFRTRISRNYCHIWNEHARICLIAKFRKRTKMSIFGYFLGRIWKKLLLLLKSAFSKWSNCKISWNNENG